jgi:hypothetical protein
MQNLSHPHSLTLPHQRTRWTLGATARRRRVGGGGKRTENFCPLLKNSTEDRKKQVGVDKCVLTGSSKRESVEEEVVEEELTGKLVSKRCATHKKNKLK